MKDNNALKEATETLPHEIKRSINMLDDSKRNSIREILLRTGKPVILSCESGQLFLGNYGRAYLINSSDCLIMSEEMMTSTFMKMCEDSVYSFMDNVNSGFLTLPGGNRVGVCGRFVSTKADAKSIRNITSLSIRIAAEHIGISEKLMSFYRRSGFGNTLIVGPPCSGKTTLLRDICRSISGDKKVSLIDERGEISGGFNVGINTDIYLNYQKTNAIEMSVRTMSPDFIIFDEIGDVSEVELVSKSMNTGVKFIFSIHAENYAELLKKTQFKLICELADIKYLVFLRREYPGKISEVLLKDESGNYSRDTSRLHVLGSGCERAPIQKISLDFGDKTPAS